MKSSHIPSRSRRDRQVLAERRQYAARLFRKGVTQAEVARQCRVSREAARQWHAAWQRGGVSSLQSRGRPGPKPGLTHVHLRRIDAALRRGPPAFGYATNLWTLERVGRVIREITDVSYGTTHIWRILTLRLGWSAQKPETRARERDERAIRLWKRWVWPQVKRGPTSSAPA